MRIRLRVPKDGKQNVGNDGNKGGSNSGGLTAWLQQLFSPSASTIAAVAPALDNRWHAANNFHYLFIGRHCVYRNGSWQSEYSFDIQADGERQQLRVVLGEPLVAAWERRHGVRMTEASRLRLATQTLESMAGVQRFPALTAVPASAIDAVSPPPG